MRVNFLRCHLKNHLIFLFGLLLMAVMITTFTCPAIARNDKVNFSDSSGEEYEKGSDKLDVPYVPTPMELVRTLLNFGSVGPDDFLIDLGSGDGRIVITAAKEYGARGFGVDLNPELVELGRKYATAEGVASRTEFFIQDIFETDIRKATVVSMYLLNEINLRLRSKLLNELRAGTRIISHDFHMGTWRPDKMLVIDIAKYYQNDSLLYLWIVPARVAGNWRWQLNLRGEEQVFDLELNQTFQNITGTVFNEGQELQIFNPYLEGDRIRFSLVSEANDRMIQQVYNGRVQGNVIDGEVQLSGTIKNTILSWRATYIWQIPPNGFLTVE